MGCKSGKFIEAFVPLLSLSSVFCRASVKPIVVIKCDCYLIGLRFTFSGRPTDIGLFLAACPSVHILICNRRSSGLFGYIVDVAFSAVGLRVEFKSSVA